MVLHSKEFENENPNYSRCLGYYDKLPEYLHEMPVQEIMEHINRNGERSRYLQGRVILTYFIWLHKTYGINMAAKNFELQQTIGKDKVYLGFFSLEELKQTIKVWLLKAEDENNPTQPDYSGLIAIFYLEWYGILPESAITIKLTDVSDDGREVFVPVENRTIAIDDEEVADYFAEYKQKTGFKRPRQNNESPYTQNTFYRNTSKKGDVITVKTIYNIRQKFITLCEDERFAKKRIYYSGRYAEMYKTEMEINIEYSGTDLESVKVIRKIFNNEEMTYNQIANLLREYAVFKKDYIERL